MTSVTGLACLAAVLFFASDVNAQSHQHGPTVRLLSTKQEIIVDYGPLTPSEHADHGGPQPAPAIFTLPEDGWMRGFAVELLDSAGHRLPNRMLHHLNVIAVGRRDLFSNEMMRLAGAGPETSDIKLPRLFGLQARRGDTVVMVVMTHRPHGTPPGPVTLRVRVRFTPQTSRIGAITLHPMSIAIGIRGQPNLFDVPPGRSEHHWEGSPSANGRIMGLSGHLHRYGALLRFEDRTTGKTLWEARPRVGNGGEVLALPVTSLISSFGVAVRSDHVYRLTAVYQNPTRDTVRADGMGVLGGALLLRRGTRWPTVNPKHPEYLADERELLSHHSHQPDEEQESELSPLRSYSTYAGYNSGNRLNIWR